jgi:glycosyltransferase involved in cell wall biosynthesis
MKTTTVAEMKTITVAIPTLGRFEVVRDTIEAFLQGSVLPTEILISDQNVPAIPELDRYLAGCPTIVRHIRTEPKGVVFNMNRLTREARGEIILFVDDDIIPGRHLVEAHLENYQGDEYYAVAGRVEQPSGDRPPGLVKRTGQYAKWTGRMTFHYNGLVRQSCDFAPGGNMSFVRARLIESGGFDEGFIGNGYFYESDGSLTFVQKFPGKMVFDPKAELQHLAAPRGGARITDRAIHTYYHVRNGLRLYRHHSPKVIYPVMWFKLLAFTCARALRRFSPRIFVNGIKGLFGLPLA